MADAVSSESAPHLKSVRNRHGAGSEYESTTEERYGGREGGSTQTDTQPAGDDKDGDGEFECNICLDKASDAVISLCGHLFCWPCLHQWLEMHPEQQLCPVCKAGIGRDKVIPVYGRGGKANVDPRTKPVPPRPQGQRPAPTLNPAHPRQQWQNQPQFHFSAGFGLLPTLFGVQFSNTPQGAPPGPSGMGMGQQRVMTAAEVQQEFLSRCLLMVGLFFLMSLLLY